MIFTVATLFKLAEEHLEYPTWEKIQRAFDFAEIPLTNLPHFSWHVGVDYQLGNLDEALQVSARNQVPFPLHVTGLGIFSGPSPVIYLPVTKTPAVSVLHNHLWELLGPMAASVNKNYDADVWIPHITLTHETTDTNAICEVISRLASVPLELEILVDHLAIIYKDDSVSGIRKKFQFGAGNL